MVIINVVREIVKLCMFIVLWGFPILLALHFGSNLYLWFLVVSIIATVGMFSHFEDLEKIDKFSEVNKDDNGTPE